MQEKSHPVIRLPIHLPNEHSVAIPADMKDDAIKSAMSRVSMLNDYFALNVRDESARRFIYPDIPTHYVYRHGKNDSVGMMHSDECNQ